MFKITKRKVKAKQNTTGEQWIRENGVLAVSDDDEKAAWRSYHKKLLSAEFECGKKVI